MTDFDMTAPILAAAAPTLQPWNVLIVDDEPGLHDVTRLVLKRLEFGGRPVRLFSVYSAKEARELLETNRDIAVAVVDVVMENDQAGLALVRDMRERFGMDLTRIILRTGNPGMAPEREVIQHFQIDDYRDKTELSADRLFTSVYTALRAYQTLKTLSQTAAGLEHIIHAAGTLERTGDVVEFIDGVLSQIAGIAHSTESLLLVEHSAAARSTPGGALVVFGVGDYSGWPARRLDAVAPASLVEKIGRALGGKVFEVGSDGVLISLSAPSGEHFALWIATRQPLEPHVARLLMIFVEKFQLNLDNARLHEEILDAQRMALGKLCEAVEMRSKETGQHIRRIAAYARVLAQLLGLPVERLDLIEAAAPLHDIGKVAVPDAILTKPGPLDADELAIMRSHAQNGHDLLSGSSSAMLKLGAEIALSHHERWDGTGYPRGLAGQSIALEARIVTLVDVFDALMSRRVYKKAFPFEKTLGIIRENAGRLFDPELVELFEANGATFLEIFERFPDDDS